MTNLFVKDKFGIERDVVLGYDNASYYPVDPEHPVYNEVPCRYVSRIGNGTFTLDTYNLVKNNGPNTPHSGPNNWSTRFQDLTDVAGSSITFSIYDLANSTGMPGRVEANVTYSLEKNKWNMKIEVIPPDSRTHLLQLYAFANPSTNKIWNHTLHLPYSHPNLAIDGNALPTGEIVNTSRNSIFDFWSAPRRLSFTTSRAEFANSCGNTCNGYNGE